MRYLMVSLIVIYGLLLLACTAPATTPPPASPEPAPVIPPVTTPTIDAGQIYAARCAACHGTDRQGISGLAPALIHMDDHDDAEHKEIIQNGRPGTAMPAFKDILTQKEIDALVQFIKSP